MLRNGTISMEEIQDRLKAIKANIERIKDESVLIEQEAQCELRELKLVEEFGNFKERLNTNLSHLEFSEKKKLVRLLVEEVFVDFHKQQVLVRHIIPFTKNLPLRPRGFIPRNKG